MNTNVVIILLLAVLLIIVLPRKQRSGFLPRIPYVPFVEVDEPVPVGDYLPTTGNTPTGEGDMVLEDYQHYPTSYYDQGGWIGNSLPWVPSGDILNDIF